MEEDEEDDEINVVVTALARGQLTALLEGAPLQSPIPPCWGGNHKSIANNQSRIQIIKQQQQRLLLLRHASKCPLEGGYCPVTPHCASMKQLWKHIMTCQDQDCKVAHCVSSRYVLSHYSTCMDQACPVCRPIREANRMTTPTTQQRPTPTRRPKPPPAKKLSEWDFAFCFSNWWTRYKSSTGSPTS